jgi:alpha-N-acetylglucosamine transferase
VLVPPHVSERKRQILRDEGATVIPVDLLAPSSWTAHPTEERWIDQFTKLRLYSLTEFTRILYMDSDMLITRPLDDIWDEEAVKFPRKTKDNSLNTDGSDLPADYVIAGVADNERPHRKRPTRITPRSILNAGFLVFRPDTDLFNYYVSLLEQPKPVFDQSFMEMGLLNYAHRNDGPMPWAALPPGQYSNNWPQLVDVESGSATLHDKFWVSGNKDWIDRELVEMWWRVQGRMEGYWEGKGLAKMQWHR